MAYKSNPVHLHCNDDGDLFTSIVGLNPSNKSKSSKLNVVSTNKFSTIELFPNQNDMATNNCQDFGDNSDDVDEYDYSVDLSLRKDNTDDDTLLHEKVEFEKEVEKLMSQEAAEEEAFIQSFMVNCNKSTLDSSYKYPKVSVMVRYVVHN